MAPSIGHSWGVRATARTGEKVNDRGHTPEAAPGAERATRSSVELEGLSKRFGDVTAVSELDLEIGRGEFFTLLGPSGCGKTTTLRVIAGFERPSNGRVLIEGGDVTGLAPHQRPTNTVFQSYALFPHLNVRENVAYGLKRKKVARPEIERRVRGELERVGLADQANRKPSQLSGGMQQRVALARAVVNLPKVLLLDEPLGALDLKLRKGLQIELKRIQREVGITFVYVTHDQEEALTMSDRIAVMNRGVVEQVAGPEEVYERPRTTFVAGFIGVSNLMPGTLGRIDGASADLRLDAGVSLSVAAPAGLAPGSSCHAVVRPEKLALSSVEAAAPDGRPSVEGTVESSLYLGTATQVLVRLPGGVSVTALVPSSDQATRETLPVAGDPVRISWAGEHTHVVRDSAAAEEIIETEDSEHERPAAVGAGR